MIDKMALVQLVATQVLIVLAVYVVVLMLLRFSNYYRVKKCPECGGKLSRHRRTDTEKWIVRLSLGILPVKRFRCYACYWEGQAFALKKDGKKDGKKEGKKAVAEAVE